jgi:hypothetical protein
MVCLQSALSDGLLKMSSFELTLKQRSRPPPPHLLTKSSCEEAAQESREAERARGDRIAENLRQRLEASESFQRAAQQRCSTLESEAKVRLRQLLVASHIVSTGNPIHDGDPTRHRPVRAPGAPGKLFR